MSDLIRLSLTTVNAPDAIALARFYAEITGGIAKGDECLEDWLERFRGVVAADCLLTVALVDIAFGVAILTTHDHLGAATPKDAHITGPSLIVLGFVVVGFAVAAYRSNPVR